MKPLVPLPGSPAIPGALTAEYGGWESTPVWQYDADAITYRLSGPGAPRYLKLCRGDGYPSLRAEAERMRWAREYLPVPVVVDQDGEGDVSWLITEGLPGQDATAAELKARPETLVPALAKGLRFFHQAPAESCPFDFRLDTALGHVRRRLGAGQIDAARDFHPEFSHLTPESAVRQLEELRVDEGDGVVCHGDYCLPNVMFVGGEASGFLDLGELGVADPYWDLAVATWSLNWNLGEGYESLFWEVYGCEPDPERTRFYRLLYDLVS